ncbi:DNA-binding protein HEXBP-like [Camellia sinensis]|uniref:DNA-binding protein HEXBP-like n=1 Tax=Camellia sinensis TaxID=4442 RepID=UPI0010365519|nr:DNA-binding protein HEXBP-like [Camellia sinensis]
MSVAEFEASFSSLSRFAPELVATEERRCFEFEQWLRMEILFKVARNMIREYDRLVEAAAHVEITVEAEEERLRNSRCRGHGSQGDYRPNKKIKGTFSSQSQPQQSRFTFSLPSMGSGKRASSGFSCFKCGQPGHKAFACSQKGRGQQMLPPPPPNRSQSQSQSQSKGKGSTCYQCGQSGHMKRACRQLEGASGTSGSRQTQSHQPTHSV